MQSISVFLDITKVADSGEKMMISAKLKGPVTQFTCFFGSSLSKVYCAKFHHCRICLTNCRKWGLLPLPSVSSPKKAHPE